LNISSRRRLHRIALQYTRKPYNILTMHIRGARWRTRLQTGRSRVRFPMVSLEFFSDIFLPVELWPWGRPSL